MRPGRPPLPERFVVRSLLGRGAFGDVFELMDQQLGMPVAGKLLRTDRPSALLRFKDEFRVVAGLHHPNLIRLYGLHGFQGSWLVTMELVEGLDPLNALAMAELRAAEGSYATLATAGTQDQDAAWEDASAPEAPGGVEHAAPPPDQVKSVFGQIATGLSALHEAGILHRDVKPSNVLVAADGQVKLLDFGLAALLQDAQGSSRAGTRTYMAPELFDPEGPGASPASDWFAFGAMLHQALYGCLPGGPRAGADAALAALCQALLDPAPERRPTGAEVLSVLEGQRQRAASDTPRASSPFVAREAELAQLQAALTASRSAPTLAVVVGASGVGKSALTQAFLGQIPEALVLRARCFQQETLPLKTLDGLVDALGKALVRRPAEELGRLLPEHLLELCQVFPVLTALPTPRVDLPPDAAEVRRRAFAALGELLAALGRERPLVISIDDAQWGDAPSGRLLAEVLQGAPVLMLATCRSADIQQAPFLAELDSAGTLGRQDLPLAPLDDAGVALLLERLLGSPPSDELAASVARESRGNPLFVEELARGRGERSLTLAQALATAGQPLPSSLLLGCVPGARWRTLDALRAHRLVRSRAFGLQESDPGQPGDQLLESYHDRIRETVSGLLSEPQRQGHHLSLAAAFAGANGDPGRVARHYSLGGEGELAVPYALLGADQSFRSLAFERSAELYELACSNMPEADERRAPSRRRQADALVQAGRCLDAAPALRGAGPLLRGGLGGPPPGRRAVDGRRPHGPGLGAAQAGPLGLRPALARERHGGLAADRGRGAPTLAAGPARARRAGGQPAGPTTLARARAPAPADRPLLVGGPGPDLGRLRPRRLLLDAGRRPGAGGGGALSRLPLPLRDRVDPAGAGRGLRRALHRGGQDPRRAAGRALPARPARLQRGLHPAQPGGLPRRR